jgi:hypothetical protein
MVTDLIISRVIDQAVQSSGLDALAFPAFVYYIAPIGDIPSNEFDFDGRRDRVRWQRRIEGSVLLDLSYEVTPDYIIVVDGDQTIHIPNKNLAIWSRV